MRLTFLDYRYAEAVLDHPDFSGPKRELLDILTRTQVPVLATPKRRRRNNRVRFFPVDQRALNRALDVAFASHQWDLQPLIVSPGHAQGPATGLKADYKKGSLQVEVQFGNMARWYTDVFKFQLSYSLGEIDVGVLVVPLQRFANLIDENVAHFERVARELPWAKMSLTLPIWVIGIEPHDYDSIRSAYDSAANAMVASGEVDATAVLPFDIQLAEDQSEPLDENEPPPPHN